MSRTEKKETGARGARTSTNSFSNHWLIDLHGLSLEQAKSTVLRNLAEAASCHITNIRIVTGRGNHKNSSGNRGVLFANFPRWIKEADLGHIVDSMTAHDGFYEIKLKPTAIETPFTAFLGEITASMSRNESEFKKLADAGDHNHELLYAKLLECDHQDFKLAFDYYLRAAKGGISGAMH